MFEQISAPDNVFAMKMSGKLTGEDVKKYRYIFEDKLKEQGQLGLVIDMNGLSDMNANAFIEGIEADFEFLKHIGRFGRLALVSDKEWPQFFIGMWEKVFPNFEMQLFSSDQRDEAIKWASVLPVKVAVETPALKRIKTDNDNVFAFEMDGVISPADFPGLIREFRQFLEDQDDVKVLNRVKHFGGIDPAIFLQKGLISMKLAAIQKVERYAIVGAPGWMRKIVEKVGPLFENMEIRTFDAEQEEQAWEWLGAQPVE